MSKTRIYRLKLMGWRLYLANCRMKKVNPSAVARHKGCYSAAMKSKKKRMFAVSGGTCDICGCRMSQDDLQLHHILPYAEFPQYGMNPSNLEMVCDECHHAIHMNPYENLQRMEQKARELGFDLREYYMKEKKC